MTKKIHVYNSHQIPPQIARAHPLDSFLLHEKQGPLDELLDDPPFWKVASCGISVRGDSKLGESSARANLLGALGGNGSAADTRVGEERVVRFGKGG